MYYINDSFYFRLEYDLKKVYATFLSEIMIDTEAAIYM